MWQDHVEKRNLPLWDRKRSGLWHYLNSTLHDLYSGWRLSMNFVPFSRIKYNSAVFKITFVSESVSFLIALPYPQTLLLLLRSSIQSHYMKIISSWGKAFKWFIYTFGFLTFKNIFTQENTFCVYFCRFLHLLTRIMSFLSHFCQFSGVAVTFEWGVNNS